MKKDFNKTATETQPMCSRCKMPVGKNHRCVQLAPFRKSVGL
jgi:hypothetical protein